MGSSVPLSLLPNSCFYALVEILAKLYTLAYHYSLFEGKMSVISGDLLHEYRVAYEPFHTLIIET